MTWLPHLPRKVLVYINPWDNLQFEDMNEQGEYNLKRYVLPQALRRNLVQPITVGGFCWFRLGEFN